MARLTFLKTEEDKQWLVDVHLPTLDPASFECALLVGNEDAPEWIEIYKYDDIGFPPVIMYSTAQ